MLLFYRVTFPLENSPMMQNQGRESFTKVLAPHWLFIQSLLSKQGEQD